MIIRGTKEKSEFHSLKGKIVYFDKVYEELPNRHKGKYRYLAIENYNRLFEIFIGKDAGDFKPEFEIIDDLKIGDEIVVYFDESSNEKDIRLNRLIQFIDKNEVPYFIRGSKDKYGGMLISGLGILIFILLLYFKKTGKII